MFADVFKKIFQDIQENIWNVFKSKTINLIPTLYYTDRNKFFSSTFKIFYASERDEREISAGVCNDGMEVVGVAIMTCVNVGDLIITTIITIVQTSQHT